MAWASSQNGCLRVIRQLKVSDQSFEVSILASQGEVASLFFFFFFLAALGLRCCAQVFSSCSKQGLLFVAVHGLLIAVASLVAEHGL